MEFCAEKGLCLGNKYFEHGSLQKYTRMARGQDGVEVKSMIDLGAADKGYASLCSGCEGSERNGTRPLKSWFKGRDVGRKPTVVAEVNGKRE